MLFSCSYGFCDKLNFVHQESDSPHVSVHILARLACQGNCLQLLVAARVVMTLPPAGQNVPPGVTAAPTKHVSLHAELTAGPVGAFHAGGTVEQ